MPGHFVPGSVEVAQPAGTVALQHWMSEMFHQCPVATFRLRQTFDQSIMDLRLDLGVRRPEPPLVGNAHQEPASATLWHVS